MQGTLIDYNGEAVKAAVIRVRKITAAASEEAFETTDRYEDGTGQHGIDGLITTLTDDDGNFLLRDLDPEARYIFQIQRNDMERPCLPEKKELLAKVRVTGWEKPDEGSWEDREEDDVWEDERDEKDDWDDGRDEKDDWDDERDEKDNRVDARHREEHWNDNCDKKESAPSNIASADLEDEYDDSEWFDIQEQEVLEQYAGNMIKPKKDLEDKLITIRKYIW